MGADVAELEARSALDAYPGLVWGGVTFTCLERVDGRWRILAAGFDRPQEARNHLAHLFLMAADHDRRAGEYRAAADVLDWEPRNEMTVAGRRFRIGRIERSVRVGPDGPEPPRSTDPEGTVAGRRSIGFIHANALTGTAAAVLRYQLHNRIPESAGDQARADARDALARYPRLVLLPAEFGVAEEIEGRWRPRLAETEATPQAARDSLTGFLRPTRFECTLLNPELRENFARMQEWIDSRRPDPRVCAEWERAADLIDREHLNEVRVAGYHFRIIRVDQVVRVGPDGPEPPRPSDPDPYGPPAADMAEE